MKSPRKHAIKHPLRRLWPYLYRGLQLEIPRRTNLSYREFVREYAEPQVPVILTDAANGWTSALQWTPDSLNERFHSREIVVDGKKTTFGDFIEVLKASDEDNPAPYFNNIEFKSHFPELLDEIPYFKYAQPCRVDSKFLSRKLMGSGWYELFIGGPGREFPFLHTDFKGVFSWITQLHGDKECVFYSPDQVEYMYPSESNYRRSAINAFNPDLEKYPLFAKAKPIRCVLKQGESLYVPPEWWHTTRMLTPSIAVVSGHITASNWSNFVRDEYRRRGKTAVPFCAYLGIAGFLLDMSDFLSGRIARLENS